MLPAMHLVLISGLSGSGKTIALRVLEDAGYYCVDNLPAPLLPALIDTLARQQLAHIAVAIDMRGGEGIEQLPSQCRELRGTGIAVSFIFLDANDQTLLMRFSETRRRHPLSDEQHTLAEAIAVERQRLEPLVGLGHHIDTSDLRPRTLRAWIKQFIEADSGEGLTLLFQSFGFKHGLPLDADLVFDARCLPNPYYEPALKSLTGKDTPVRRFLEAEEEVLRMRADLYRFIDTWLPCYIRDNRSNLTVAVGCTGGQHRSVYLCEWLAQQFADRSKVLVRHRELAD